jgi:hypothetical protein
MNETNLKQPRLEKNLTLTMQKQALQQIPQKT